MYAKHVTKAQLDKMKTFSASQTSTGVQELALELEASNYDAAIMMMQLESRVESLWNIEFNLKLAKDNDA